MAGASGLRLIPREEIPHVTGAYRLTRDAGAPGFYNVELTASSLEAARAGRLPLQVDLYRDDEAQPVQRGVVDHAVAQWCHQGNPDTLPIDHHALQTEETDRGVNRVDRAMAWAAGVRVRRHPLRAACPAAFRRPADDGTPSSGQTSRGCLGFKATAAPAPGGAGGGR